MAHKLSDLPPQLRRRIIEQMNYEDQTRNQKSGSGPGVQESQTHDQAEERLLDAGNRQKSKAVDGKVHPKFRVTIVLRYSNRKRRDLDGALSTILDCLVNAARRFVGMDK